MYYKVDMEFIGKHFSPAKFLKMFIVQDFDIVCQNEVGELGITANKHGSKKRYEFGVLSIRNKHQLGGVYKTNIPKELPYEEWYISFLEQHSNKIIECGVEELILLTSVYFLIDEQCNLESFDGYCLSVFNKH